MTLSTILIINAVPLAPWWQVKETVSPVFMSLVCEPHIFLVDFLGRGMTVISKCLSSPNVNNKASLPYSTCKMLHDELECSLALTHIVPIYKIT